MEIKKTTADVCLITEGSYPYYPGGVTRWTEELIREQKETSFHILSLVPPRPDLSSPRPFPDNVVGHSYLIVQDLPEGAPSWRTPKGFWEESLRVFQGMTESKSFSSFAPLLELVAKHRSLLGKRILSESREAWDFFLCFYREVIPSGPFKASFATIFTLSRSLFSLMLPELPDAKLFHSVCTGYAGFLLYRAKVEKGVPCLITEHGVYTNERRIEIAMSEWMSDLSSLDLDIEGKKNNLRDLWINAFYSMAHACYQSCDQILSTFQGTQSIQLQQGASPHKLRTILHGINPAEYTPLIQKRKPHPPTIAFIGRIVPIKDIKTYIRACHIVSQKIQNVRFLLLGPTTEDPDYVQECKALIDSLQMQDKLVFSGSVDLKAYFPEIDLLVLTSISEVQPLIQLEAGAMGIPAIATNVGAASEIILGKEGETPPLGAGGIVTPLVSPDATVQAILRLLEDHPFYEQCSQTIATRIQTYYKLQEEQSAYHSLYTHPWGATPNPAKGQVL
ncbi:MAG: GT4 family glycosyltransferase PelF [Verrucomicrobiota bacterium]|nr:GT4 family glycosyltransferase PelF [Verrucomicrobiota bacterium]